MYMLIIVCLYDKKVHIPDPNKLPQSLHMITEKGQTPYV